jgi:hypothetical protein
MRIGDNMTVSISVSKARQHSIVHLNRVSFFNKLVSSQVKWVKFRIKGC